MYIKCIPQPKTSAIYIKFTRSWHEWNLLKHDSSSTVTLHHYEQDWFTGDGVRPQPSNSQFSKKPYWLVQLHKWAKMKSQNYTAVTHRGRCSRGKGGGGTIADDCDGASAPPLSGELWWILKGSEESELHPRPPSHVSHVQSDVY